MANGTTNAARTPADSESADSHKALLKSFLSHFPTISLVASAIIYTTGFLTIFLFHGSYRLRGVDSDFFKAKFFHVGIMFAALLMCLVFPLAALFGYLRYRKGPPEW